MISFMAKVCSPKLSRIARKFIPLRNDETSFKIQEPNVSKMLFVVVGIVIILANEPENMMNKLTISVNIIEIIGLSVREDINIPTAISAAPKSIIPKSA